MVEGDSLKKAFSLPPDPRAEKGWFQWGGCFQKLHLVVSVVSLEY